MSEASTEIVVAVVGCATVGSEIAAALADAGATVLAIDASARPYGELEAQIPAWHAVLVSGQIGRIDENLAHPNITFVPKTAVGHDVSLERLEALGATVIQATGRAHTHTDSHQTLLHWFNHRGHLAWPGPNVTLPSRVAVVGDGLAAFEAARLVSLELHGRALADRDHHIGSETLAATGIGPTLTRLGIRDLDVSVTLIIPGGLDRLLAEAPQDLRGAAIDALRNRDLVKLLPGFDVAELTADTLHLIHSGGEGRSGYGEGLELKQPCDLLVDARVSTGPSPTLETFSRLAPALAHKLWEARLTPARSDDAAIARGEALAEALGTAIRQLVQPLVDQTLARPSPAGTTERALAWAKARHAAVGYDNYGDWIGDTRRRWL